MGILAETQAQNSSFIGPETGTLVIAGGGSLSDGIYQRVIDLAGGNDSAIVVILTANGAESYDQDAAEASNFRRLGVKNVTVLHTYNPQVADTKEFVKPLFKAKGVGFGYIKNTTIDQHVLVRNRQFDMFDILKVRPELLGFGIDENTALVVSKNNAEVIGASYIAVYDGGFWSREGSDIPGMKNVPNASSMFYYLRDGDRYDLGTRKVVE